MSQDLGIQMIVARLESGEARSTDGKSGVKSGTGGSWFEALGAALGGILGDRVMALIDAKNRMVDNYKESLNVKKGEQQSRAYMQAMTDFQVQSQLFGMESQIASTAIKAIGEGLTQIGRKQ